MPTHKPFAPPLPPPPQADALPDTLPDQLAWCGSDAVLLFWEVRPFFPNHPCTSHHRQHAPSHTHTHCCRAAPPRLCCFYDASWAC